MWWRKKPKPQSEFWDRCDKAAEITRWDDRMDSFIGLMQENPEEYVSWTKARWRKEA